MNQVALDEFADAAKELAEEAHGIAALHAHGELKSDAEKEKVCEKIGTQMNDLTHKLKEIAT